MTAGAIGIFVGLDLDLAVQLRWAQRLAEARDADLIMLQHVESSDRVIEEIPLDGSAKGDAASVEGANIASEELADEIRSVVRDRFEKPVGVRMLTAVDADAEQPAPRSD